MRRLFILLLPLFLYAKPNLLLLKTYKDQDIAGWVMSEKLDGIRAYWDGQKLISRGGKVIHAPTYFTKGYPSFALDGELWSKRGDFEYISATVRDIHPSKNWKNIKYHIFDVPHAKGNLLQRLRTLKPYESTYLKTIKQINIKNKQHMQTFLKEVEDKKGEGLVLRDPLAPYINKRTNKALKVKSYIDAECKVTGYTPGKGKFQGLLGALICQLPNHISFKIGSGFTNNIRKSPPKLGTIVTFKYQALTKYGKPRFPVFLRIRKDNTRGIAK